MGSGQQLAGPQCVWQQTPCREGGKNGQRQGCSQSLTHETAHVQPCSPGLPPPLPHMAWSMDLTTPWGSSRHGPVRAWRPFAHFGRWPSPALPPAGPQLLTCLLCCPLGFLKPHQDGLQREPSGLHTGPGMEGKHQAGTKWQAGKVASRPPAETGLDLAPFLTESLADCGGGCAPSPCMP